MSSSISPKDGPFPRLPLQTKGYSWNQPHKGAKDASAIWNQQAKTIGRIAYITDVRGRNKLINETNGSLAPSGPSCVFDGRYPSLRDILQESGYLRRPRNQSSFVHPGHFLWSHAGVRFLRIELCVPSCQANSSLAPAIRDDLYAPVP